MKKVFLNCLIIAAIALMAVAVTSCKRKGSADVKSLKTSGEVKLLESIIDNDGSATKFEYDAQNRIVKLLNEYNETYTLTYSGNDLVKIERTPNDNDGEKYFDIKGNTITIEGRGWGDTLTVNKDGYIGKWTGADHQDRSEIAFQYQHGNVTKRTTVNINDEHDERFELTSEYKYDDKRSPFYNNKTPKWFLQWYFIYRLEFGLNNNVTERYTDSSSTNKTYASYIYEYDNDGLPTKQTTTETELDSSKTTYVTAFTYLGEAGSPPDSEISPTTEAEKVVDPDVVTGAFNGVITAHVENGSALNSRIKELYAAEFYVWSGTEKVYNRVPVSGTYVNSGFTVTLPEKPDTKYLSTVEDTFGYHAENASDKNANIFKVNEIHGLDRNGSLAAAFKLYEIQGDDDDAFEYYVSFYYADRDVLIYWGGEDGAHVNLNLKKGWNKVYTREHILTGNFDRTTVPPECNVKWRLLSERLELSHTVEFRDEKIPMTVYGDYDYSKNEGILDRLVFTYKGATQTVPLTGIGFWNRDTVFDLISVNDYNFDNYMDIAVNTSGSAYNTADNIFLYDPQTKGYIYHEELSELIGVWIDGETQTIKTHMKGGHAGMLYNASEYKWENGQLTLVSTSNQDYDDSLELYILKTRTLQDGVWIEKTETFKEEDFM